MPSDLPLTLHQRLVRGLGPPDRELLDVAGLATFRTDVFGKIAAANHVAYGLLGTDPEFLIGKLLVSFVDGRDRRRFRRLLLRLEHGSPKGELDVRLRRRDEVTLDALVTVVQDGSAGKPGSLSWLVRDVTELRQAERQLWELNAELERRAVEKAEEIVDERTHLAALIAQLPVGLLVVDAEGMPLVVNALLGRILGVEVTPGRPLTDRWPEGKDATGRRYRKRDWPVARSLERHEEVSAERIDLVRGDGSTRVVEVTSTPLLEPDGTIGGAIASFADVTARSSAERAEREFIENAAHELATPVAAIAGAVAALQLGAKDEPTARETFLRHIERDCERLVRLGAALLTLARAQAGLEQPRLEVVEIRPLLDDLADHLRPAPAVLVHVTCPPLLAALTNRDLIWHALSNLAGNAARFTSRGTVELSARPVDRRAVSIEVADTGPGIADAERERVTERFYTAPARGDGYGLGLAIARQAAEVAGGRLELRPRKNGGTVAGVRLPAARFFPVEGE